MCGHFIWNLLNEPSGHDYKIRFIILLLKHDFFTFKGDIFSMKIYIVVVNDIRYSLKSVNTCAVTTLFITLF